MRAGCGSGTRRTGGRREVVDGGATLRPRREGALHPGADLAAGTGCAPAPGRSARSARPAGPARSAGPARTAEAARTAGRTAREEVMHITGAHQLLELRQRRGRVGPAEATDRQHRVAGRQLYAGGAVRADRGRHPGVRRVVLLQELDQGWRGSPGVEQAAESTLTTGPTRCRLAGALLQARRQRSPEPVGEAAGELAATVLGFLCPLSRAR